MLPCRVDGLCAATRMWDVCTSLFGGRASCRDVGGKSRPYQCSISASVCLPCQESECSTHRLHAPHECQIPHCCFRPSPRVCPRNLTLVHALGIGDRIRKGTNRSAHPGMTKRVSGGHWTWSPTMLDMARAWRASHRLHVGMFHEGMRGDPTRRDRNAGFAGIRPRPPSRRRQDRGHHYRFLSHCLGRHGEAQIQCGR